MRAWQKQERPLERATTATTMAAAAAPNATTAPSRRDTVTEPIAPPGQHRILRMSSDRANLTGAWPTPSRSGSTSRRGEASPWSTALRELGAVDRATYRAIAQTPTPSSTIRFGACRTRPTTRDCFGIAAALAVLGGRRGRRAALEGVVAIGVTSATVNLLAKSLAARPRPHREELEPFLRVPSRCRRPPRSPLATPRRHSRSPTPSVAICPSLRSGPAPCGRSRLLAGAYRCPLPG